MRLGAQPTRLEPGSARRQLLRHDGDLRAASPSLRVQQPLPPAVRRPRHAVLRHEPRRLAGRNHRAARASRGSWPCSTIRSSSRSRPPPQPLFAGFIGAAVAHSHGKAGRSAAGEAVATNDDRFRSRAAHPPRSERCDGRRKEDHHRRRLEVAGRRPKRKRPSSKPGNRSRSGAVRRRRDPATCRCRPRRSRCSSRRSSPKR